MIGAPLVRTLTERWWVWLLRGAVAILFGVMAFARPGVTLNALVLLYGAYVLLDGAFTLTAGVMTKTWGLILSGILGILAGIVTFAYPGITELVLIYIIASCAILTGVMQIIAAVRFREVIKNEWVLGVGGGLSILVGLWMAARPGAGLVATVWLIGYYALLFGILMVALAFRLRSLGTRLTPVS